MVTEDIERLYKEHAVPLLLSSNTAPATSGSPGTSMPTRSSASCGPVSARTSA